MKIYWLHINTDDVQTYNAVSAIMQVMPEPNEPYWFDPNPNLFSTWSYKVTEEDDGPVFDFINHFLDLLQGKYDALAAYGIARKDILFWLVYEYNQQCAMEFHPEEMKRLGESGIVLNIDCHSKKQIE